jgi:AraC-like DNA-binding protein
MDDRREAGHARFIWPDENRMNDSPSPIPGNADPLGEALHFLHMSGVFYCRSDFRAPWGLTLPAFEHCMMFHVITAGECLLEVEGAGTQLLRAGDLALMPHGEGHRLLGAPGADAPNLFDLPRSLVSDRYELLQHGGDGAATSLICGVVRFEHPAARQLLGLLPKCLRVDGWEAPEMEWIQSTLRFIAAEARTPRAGGETVITRLADILVIQAIRAWMHGDAAAQSGWLGALRHRQVGRAIAAIHRRPGQPWTLATLAAEAGMSRSAFAAKFSELVGEPAMHYATRWKMSAAQQWLKDSNASLAQLANRLGYDSEAAFQRAFKRIVGQTPGAVRRQLRAVAGPLPMPVSSAPALGVPTPVAPAVGAR